MIQEIYIPTDPKLSNIVNFLSYVEITENDHVDGFSAIFPNATSNILFSLQNKISVNRNLINTSIYASCSSTVAIRPYIGMKFLTVQFKSFGLYYLTRIPTHELHDNLYDLDTLFSTSDIDRIVTQLNETEILNQKFKILESFISEKVTLYHLNSRLPFAVNSIKSEQNLSIDTLSNSLNISSRGLLKIFNKYIGMSPSRYRNIMRFNHAVNLLLNNTNDSLTSIAYQCGYFDQSHFIKDFRKFGGVSPSEFLELKAHSSDFYNYNLHDIDNFTLK